ncbi:hypothetical protein E5288_WYG019976 [Bos mutus]|uniref:Uncharacterized protein n=1 Tax=Bos mutus TaxID=72004 RepID=A0A6B0RFJ5_9CETA|nr:hypothetical protein [Bos mutus]
MDILIQLDDFSRSVMEGVLKSEKEHFILKNIHEQAQDHMLLLSGPQFCGSQEFWFGKTCEEEKSTVGRWPDYPK